MNKYLVIPGGSDYNRGDQALTWESINLAKDLGYEGEYYLTAGAEINNQTLLKGIKIIDPVLKHPSRFYKKSKNINYNIFLKIKWGLVAIFDFIFSLLILSNIFRKLFYWAMPNNIKNTLSIYNESDAVFVKGGGFIHAYGGITSFYYMYYSLYHLLLAKKMKKYLFCMPNSFGPFDGPGVKSFARYVLNKCDILLVREKISKDYLDECKVSNTLFPDLGFYLEKSETIDLKFKETKKNVAITVRPYRFPEGQNTEAEDKYEKYVNSLIEFIEWLNEKGYTPIMVNHCLALNDHEKDMICIEKIVKKLSFKVLVISDDSYDCTNLKQIYSNCDYIVGTRFHSMIFSFGEMKPGIAITYGGNKGKGILEWMDISECGIAIDKITYETLKDKFIYTVNNYETLIKKLENYNTFTRKQREEFRKKYKNEKSIINN